MIKRQRAYIRIILKKLIVIFLQFLQFLQYFVDVAYNN